MRKLTNFCLVSLIMIIFVCSCTQRLPRSEYPIQFKRDFNASFDKTWDAVLTVIKRTHGTIITKDKSSGLIVFSRFDSIFFNILIMDDFESNIATVYFKPMTKSGPYMRTYTKSGKSLKDVDVLFFENLERTLKKGR